MLRGCSLNRLLDAYFGRSDRMIWMEKRPLSVRMRRPLGLDPQLGLPSARLPVEETNVHAFRRPDP